MKAQMTWLGCVVMLAGATALGCESDPPVVTGTDAGPGGGPTDAGPGGGADGSTAAAACPATAPDMGTGMMGACCFRESNEAKQAAPEFRLAAIRITQPATLANPAISGIVSSALDEERFNWLIQVAGAPAGTASGPITMKTGFGLRAMDHSYGFTTAGGTPSYPPVMLNGTATNNGITTPRATGVFTVPILSTTGAVIVELPLAGLEILKMDMTENRSCVGRRRARDYDPAAGQLGAFLTITATKAVPVELLMRDLCTVISSPPMGMTCDTAAQTTWTVKPDSICDGTGCRVNMAGMTDACDPSTTCNAWQLLAGFAAQGVNITN